MRKKTFKNGIKRIGSGIGIITYCAVSSGVRALADAGLGIKKHPILAVIIIASYLFMVVTMMQAREDRDRYNEQAYNQELKVKSYETLMKAPHNANVTGSHQ